MKNLYINGYKSLKDLKLTDLSRVNYLVGGNASGKTSLLESLRFLGRALEFSFDQGDFTMQGLSKHSVDKDGFTIQIDKDNHLSVGMNINYDMVETTGNVVHHRQSIFVTDGVKNFTFEKQAGSGTWKSRIVRMQYDGKKAFEISTRYISTKLTSNTHTIKPEHIKFDMINLDEREKTIVTSFLNEHHPKNDNQKYIEVVKSTLGDDSLSVKLAKMGVVEGEEAAVLSGQISHPLPAISDGMHALLGILVDIERKINELPETDTVIICLEEPENGLEAKNQKKITDILGSIADRHPNVVFFISTHSPFVISEASQKAHQKIYLLDQGKLTNLYGEKVNESTGYNGDKCLNVVANMLGAGFGDLNGTPRTSEELTIVYCEGTNTQIKDSQIYKRIFKDKNIVFVSAKDLVATVTAFRIGEQASRFVFGEKTEVRALVDRSNGCRECNDENDHHEHEQEFTITKDISIKFTHKNHLIFDDDELSAIESTEPTGRLRVLKRKEIENYLFDESVVNLLDQTYKDQLTIPDGIDYVNGEVKDQILGASPDIYKLLADIIYDYRKTETKEIYDELANYVGLDQNE